MWVGQTYKTPGLSRTHHHLLQQYVLQVPVLVAVVPVVSQHSPVLSCEHLEGSAMP